MLYTQNIESLNFLVFPSNSSSRKQWVQWPKTEWEYCSDNTIHGFCMFPPCLSKTNREDILDILSREVEYALKVQPLSHTQTLGFSHIHSGL